jgi:hypothetical protein
MIVKNLAGALALLALAACGPKAPEAPPAPPAPVAAEGAAGACSATASMDWAPVAGASYRIEGSAAGPACNEGTATLTVKDGAGKTLYTGQHEIAPMANTVFAEATTPEKLGAALTEWIDPAGSTQMRTTRALPDWPRGADGPVSGEFPFYPEEGMNRDAYLRLRAQDKPLYCFVQGGESMQCFALDVAAGTLTPVGLQTFPG